MRSPHLPGSLHFLLAAPGSSDTFVGDRGKSIRLIVVQSAGSDETAQPVANGGRMENRINDPQISAALLAIRNQHHNLEETIASLVDVTLSQPVGKLRNALLQEVSCLDSIADLMRQALDSVAPERGRRVC